MNFELLGEDTSRLEAFDRLRSKWSGIGEAESAKLLEALEDMQASGLLRRMGDVWDVIDEIGRPMIPISLGTFNPPQAERWHEAMAEARPTFESAGRAVGRLEVDGLDSWVGTGWLVETAAAPGIVVTNRHVVRNHFGRGIGDAAEFLAVGDSHLTVSFVIDAAVEGEPASRYPVASIVWIDANADLALLRLAPTALLPSPIPLGIAVTKGAQVALIGYPGDDPEEWADNNLFGGSFGRQAISPGLVVEIDGVQFTHDASTTGGSSGSPALDFNGHAVGVHFRGKPRLGPQFNAALNVQALRDCLVAAGVA